MARHKKAAIEVENKEPEVKIEVNKEEIELLKKIVEQNNQIILLLQKLKDRFV